MTRVVQSLPPRGRNCENNMSIVVRGPRASPPARVSRNPDRESNCWRTKGVDEISWLFSKRAGGDACGPSTPMFILFSRLREWVVMTASKFCQENTSLLVRYTKNTDAAQRNPNFCALQPRRNPWNWQIKSAINKPPAFPQVVSTAKARSPAPKT